MSTGMEVDDQLDRWLAEDISSDLLITPLSDEIAEIVVEHLKREADRYWPIDPNRSVDFAERIISIGSTRDDKRQIALGLMARGDALKFLNQMEAAWDALDMAGKLFQASDDDVGWARTRIGRLYLGLTLNRVDETLGDVGRARGIFMDKGELEKLLRLEINTAYVHNQLGDQHQALDIYHSALEIANALGDKGYQHLGLIHMNIGFAHESLGDFPQALKYYEKARELFSVRNETRNIANIELNIAYIAQVQSQYRTALHLLYGILDRGIEQFPVEEMAVKQDLTECYLRLNRYSEARDLALQVINNHRETHVTYDTARILLHLATAEAEMGNLTAAQSALDEATAIFVSLGATTWEMIARLRNGQIALKQGELDVARKEARVAADHFQKEGQQYNHAMASLLLGQISLAVGDYSNSSLKGYQVLQVARRSNVPSLRYAAYLLLGGIAIARGRTLRAIRCFQAATATIDRIQRRLTITLRHEFLEDKDEAGRELVRLYLRQGRTKRAFEALERAKSQVLLNYLNNREQLHWVRGDPKNRALLEELENLRAGHQWFYRLAHEPPRDGHRSANVSVETALAEVRKRERRMRAITEQLYLHSNDGMNVGIVPINTAEEIQEKLDDDSILIEFFNDGNNLWAFTLDEQTVSAHPLSITIDKLNRLIHQLQVNFSTALNLGSQAVSDRKLTHLGQLILNRLYALLIEPLDLHLKDNKRLIIVPYGLLHYLPFNVLYDGVSYLNERHEIVILPAANLVTQAGPEQASSALILSNSQGGRYPQTHKEAQLVHRMFGGTLHTEETATRATLKTKPSKILHIAAHGQYRLDHPELSYLELADGQLYTDDLLQEDLGYELVTLSGCETGRAHVSGGDELIGLGRGLLYAGAGALLLSLWQVADSSTVSFMQIFYHGLRTGKSKAAALRDAQRSILRADRQLHPAFWGAFQLIGNAGPLSTGERTTERS